MKKADLILIACVAAVLAAFAFIPGLYEGYNAFNAAHGIVMSFVKFAILATLGECIALRITAGCYNRKGFGVLPKALVWGFLGIVIKLAFIVFATGVPNVLAYFTVPTTGLLGAFAISTFMNLIFAPVLMTVHKITDEHIHRTGGTFAGLFSPVPMGQILRELNWDIMWNFVFKKTIPMFWIPAHTITFMLPPDFRVLFAALLGIALGVILAFAALKSAK